MKLAPSPEMLASVNERYRPRTTGQITKRPNSARNGATNQPPCWKPCFRRRTVVVPGGERAGGRPRSRRRPGVRGGLRGGAGGSRGRGGGAGSRGHGGAAASGLAD